MLVRRSNHRATITQMTDRGCLQYLYMETSRTEEVKPCVCHKYLLSHKSLRVSSQLNVFVQQVLQIFTVRTTRIWNILQKHIYKYSRLYSSFDFCVGNGKTLKKKLKRCRDITSKYVYNSFQETIYYLFSDFA